MRHVITALASCAGSLTFKTNFASASRFTQIAVLHWHYVTDMGLLTHYMLQCNAVSIMKGLVSPIKVDFFKLNLSTHILPNK